MPEDGVIQLRRNTASKTGGNRSHISRYGKPKGSSSRLVKLNGGGRATGLHKSMNSSSHSLSSINSQSSEQAHIQQQHQHQHQPQQQPQQQVQQQAQPHQFQNTAEHTSGSHRMMKRAINHPTASVLGQHRYKGLSSGLGNLAQSYRKPIIQLEKEDDDDDLSNSSGSNEFEDLDDDEDDKDDVKTDDHRLSVGIHPVEPTPPKLSDETVISVSSFADMASALKGARDKSGFVNDADLISTAVNRSKNLGDMAQMVHGWGGGTSNRNGISGVSSLHPSASSVNIKRNKKQSRGAVPGEDDPREFEKVFREYTNARAVRNPMINSLCRISLAQSGTDNASSLTSSLAANDNNADSGSSAQYFGSLGRNSRYQLPSIKKVNSLVATTSNQISDYTESGNGTAYPDAFPHMAKSRGTSGGASTFILNKIWQSGWDDPDSAKSPSNSNDDIHGQAIKVQTRLAKTKERNSALKSKAGMSSIRLSSMQ